MNHSATDIKRTKNEIEFRLQFKEDYGIDYLEAIERLNKRKRDSERRWINMLIKNGVIT